MTTQPAYWVEEFTADERARLAPYFTNLDRPVFALRNLPETVKGALFARYSRSGKTLRRLFLDEFADQVEAGERPAAPEVGEARATALYQRVFDDYGDDSVAQLGGAHVACEQASNLLTKLLEWGRLAAYLEQSTRYVSYADRPGGRWRYHLDPDVDASDLGPEYRRVLDGLFATYAELLPSADRAPGHGRAPRARVERGRLAAGRQGAGPGRAARPAAGRHHLQPGHLRHRAGVRGAAAAPARLRPARGPRLRRPAAGGAAPGHPGVPAPGRPRGAGGRLVALPGRDGRRDGQGGRGRAGRRPAGHRARPLGPAHRVRPGRRGQGR